LDAAIRCGPADAFYIAPPPRGQWTLTVNRLRDCFAMAD
jgi:hypothetical protein